MPRRSSRWLVPALAAVALLAVASPSYASILVALDLGELVRGADVVVVGTVVRTETRRDARRRIVTDAIVRVDESMKGTARPAEEIVVRTLGGVIGDIGMRVEGEPSFTTGDRAVLFARRSRVGAHFRAVGMAQGVLPVAVDARGVEVAMPGAVGMALVRRDAAGRLVDAQAALTTPRTLDALRAEIRDLAGDAGN